MAKPNLSENTVVVHGFLRAIKNCTLPHVPQWTREILSTGAWRERFEHGRRIAFDDFVEFITLASSKGGCGLDPDKVTALLRKSEDIEALDLWLTAIRQKEAHETNANAPNLLDKGGDRRSEIFQSSDGKNSATLKGRGSTYAHARLRRDRPDLHARVLAGEISAHAAMVEAGFRKKRQRKPKSVLPRILKLLPELTPGERDELQSILVDWNDGRRAA